MKKINKWLKNTIVTVLLIILLIAIYIGLSLLLERADLEDIDITTNKLYTLTQETKDKIANIKETKIIIAGFNRENYEGILETITNYAKLYAKANSQITYEQIENIIQRPDLATKYGLDSTSMVVIVETENNTKILTSEDLYTYDYITYSRIENIEQAITNAIIDVNIENKPKIYFVTNHIKYAGSSKVITEYLKNEANEVEELDLLINGNIPEDCKVLVITTLKEDITDFEKQIITQYINNGGKILILADPNTENIELNNYNQILEMYGVSISKGYIYEQDVKRTINNIRNIIIPDINYSSPITKYIARDGTIVLINTGKLNFKTDEELESMQVQVRNLITASETAFYREDLTQTTNKKTEKDEVATGFSLGAHITKTITKEEEKTSELIIFANSLFASDISIQLSSQIEENGIYFYNNKDLILNSISKLTQRTDTITVRKDTGLITYMPTEEQDRNIKIIIISLPVTIITIGIIIWQARRRK